MTHLQRSFFLALKSRCLFKATQKDCWFPAERSEMETATMCLSAQASTSETDRVHTHSKRFSLPATGNKREALCLYGNTCLLYVFLHIPKRQCDRSCFLFYILKIQSIKGIDLF